MNTIVKSGILIALLCGVWEILMGVTGWYKDPVMMNVFYVVIAIQAGVLIWGLRKTAGDRSYGGQVGAGTLMSLVAGIFIIGISYLFTTVLYPHYFEEMRLVTEEVLRNKGMSDAEVTAQLKVAEVMQTSMMNALAGFTGTMVTGVVVSAIIAIFVRKKPGSPTGPVA
jgi:hypothetical protein